MTRRPDHAEPMQSTPAPRKPAPLPLWRSAATRAGVLLTAFMLVLLMAAAPVAVRAADGVEILQAHLEPSEEGLRLSASFVFDLNRGLEDALIRGVPLYFTTEVDISRERWYWFDQTAVSTSRTIRISYNVLTRQYYAAAVGQLQQSFPTLEDALLLVRRPSRWVVAPPGTLKPGVTYDVTVKMGLDVAQLPKPFQVHALNSSDWRLASDRMTFQYRMEGQ